MVSNPQSFRAEAAYQIACLACGAIGKPFHAHHVVDKAELKSWGIPEADRYDTRLAARLCSPGAPNNCHLQFENRRVVIPLTALSDDHIEAAFEHAERHGLATRAYEYLKREYSGDDIRVEEMLRQYEESDLSGLVHGTGDYDSAGF